MAKGTPYCEDCAAERVHSAARYQVSRAFILEAVHCD
jgi:hypothetical protein